MVFVNIAILLGALLALFAIYEIIGLFRKRAETYYVMEDGKLRRFGDVRFHISSNNYVFRDNNQSLANRLQGFSHVDDGLAKISLRNDPSGSDLSLEMHEEGWVDLKGNIYGKDGIRVGYITDAKGREGINGLGKWSELWLRKHSYVFSCPPLASEDGSSMPAKDRLVGAVVETGRLGRVRPGNYTLTARAAGCLLLYKDRQPRPESEDALSTRTTWKDTALPAALLFVFIYGLFYLTSIGKFFILARGEQIGFTAAMLAVYFVIWAILRQMKVEAALNGRSFDDFLLLIDKNTGMGGLNNWIILASAGSLLVSIFMYGYDFAALQAAILIGTWVNRRYVTGQPWAVTSSSEEDTNFPDYPEDETPSVPDDGMAVQRSFQWVLDSPYHQLKGDLTLSFDKSAIQELRETNPFHLNPSEGFTSNIKTLLETCTHNAKVHEVLRYINRLAQIEGLSDLEHMQFILDFVQRPNIQYVVDSKCEEIGHPREYARFPDETMFDGRGDCDCKAVLAAILFREAGYKTAYLTTEDHAAVAVAFKDKYSAELLDLAGESLLSHDGYLYFFCETTGDGYKIGDLGDTTRESIESILPLN